MPRPFAGCIRGRSGDARTRPAWSSRCTPRAPRRYRWSPRWTPTASSWATCSSRRSNCSTGAGTTRRRWRRWSWASPATTPVSASSGRARRASATSMARTSTSWPWSSRTERSAGRGVRSATEKSSAGWETGAPPPAETAWLQGVQVREQGLLKTMRPSRSPGRVPFESHRFQPPTLAEGVQREKPLLGTAQPVRVLEEPRAGHRPQLPAGGLDLHRVAGERLPGVLHGEALGGEPQGGLPARQRLLTVHPPVPKARVAQGVQHPHEACGEEGAPELLLAVAHPGGEPQDLGRRPAAVVAPRVREVRLGVVVLDEALVRRGESGPALGPCEVPVGHPALDVEVRFDVVLPRPPALYLVLGYAQSLVDGPRLGGTEDPAVGHQRLRRAVALDGGVEHREVGGEVLRPGQRACEDRAGVVVQHGDRVGPAADAVVVHVPDVIAPVLVPPPRREGHLLLLLHRPLGLLQSVDLAVQGEYSAAGPRAQVYADLG